jgi:hypothetical protein
MVGFVFLIFALLFQNIMEEAKEIHVEQNCPSLRVHLRLYKKKMVSDK